MNFARIHFCCLSRLTLVNYDVIDIWRCQHHFLTTIVGVSRTLIYIIEDPRGASRRMVHHSGSLGGWMSSVAEAVVRAEVF